MVNGLSQRLAGGATGWSDEDLASAVTLVTGLAPSADVGVAVWDAVGDIVTCTDTAELILGMTLSQMRGRTVSDPRWTAVSADGQPLSGDAHPSMVTLLTGLSTTNFVMGVRHIDGSAGNHAWLSVDSHLLPTGADLPPGAVISVLTAIEGSRVDELRLVASERMLRMISERSQEMVGIHTLEGIWLWASPAAATVLGHPPADLLGTSMFDVVVPDDIAEAHRALATVVSGDGPVSVAIRARHREGRKVWIEVIGQLITDDAGRPYQIQTSTRDVTPRIVAEQARDAAIEVFTTVMENSPIGMVLHDLDGRVRTTNLALQELLRCTAEDLRGTSLIDRLHPGDRDRVAADVQAIVDGDRTVNRRREARFLLPDQTSIWVESTTVLLRAFDGTPTSILEQLHDVSARKDADADLERRATSDALTGLPNRTRFLDLLDHAIESARTKDQQIAVLFVDLDGFKTVNDTYGHPAGDELLVEVADRLTSVLAPSGTATRYGGDEFAAMFRAVDVASVGGVVEAVAAVLGGPFVLEGVTVTLSSSVGVAVGTGKSALTLLREADRSMYLVKRSRHDDPFRRRADQSSAGEDAWAQNRLGMRPA